MKRTGVLPAPRVDPPEPGKGKWSKWNKERRAFQRLRPSLLRTYLGKYVAIHQGKVVDSGKDQIKLALRAYARFGYIPIYVGQVLAEPPPSVRIPSPRVLRLIPA
jgi:hypothetical protein